MPDYTHNTNDIYELLTNTFLQSSNFGSLRAGQFADLGDGKNEIVSRGSILFDRSGDAVSDVWIDFYNDNRIHLYVQSDTNNLGFMSVLYYGLGLYQGDEHYEYDGYTWGDSALNPTQWTVWTQDTQQITAWSISPYTVSFYYQLTTSGDFYFGFMVVPESYNAGIPYPFDVPIETIEEKKISRLLIPIYNGAMGDTPTVVSEGIYQFFMDLVQVEIDYDEGDDIPTGGGGGSYESRNDYMNFPSLPSLSATNTGFVSLYAPTSAQLESIANWLWSDNFFDNILKNYSDPFNNILGLFISPITPPSVASQFKVGNVDSGLTANKVGNQYAQISCGSVSVSKYYNSFADYDNYRSFKCFLPYYGIVDLSTDDFIGGSLEVRYNIDYFTGSTAIFIRSNRSGTPHILHQYSTNIYAPIPFSGQNMTNFYNQTFASALSIVSSGISGNIATMGSGVMGLLNAHPTYGGSRGMGSTAGLMGIQYPYLIECRSIRDMPSGYSKNTGIPLNKVMKCYDLSGYTEFEQIHVHIQNATDDESKEIESILKEGVIL